MIDFEVFIGRTEQNRKKTYLVAEPGTTYIRMCEAAKKFFRCSEAHLEIVNGYVLNDELYLEDPHKRGAKLKCVAFYV